MPNIQSIFLIEDDSDDQALFTEALREINDTILLSIATDGSEGLQTLQKSTGKVPDLIFVDLNMPRMDGLEFVREAKKDSPLNCIPIVMYSTSAAEMYRLEAIRLGVSAYIVKPAKFSALCEMIRLAIEKDWSAVQL